MSVLFRNNALPVALSFEATIVVLHEDGHRAFSLLGTTPNIMTTLIFVLDACTGPNLLGWTLLCLSMQHYMEPFPVPRRCLTDLKHLRILPVLVIFI